MYTPRSILKKSDVSILSATLPSLVSSEPNYNIFSMKVEYTQPIKPKNLFTSMFQTSNSPISLTANLSYVIASYRDGTITSYNLRTKQSLVYNEISIPAYSLELFISKEKIAHLLVLRGNYIQLLAIDETLIYKHDLDDRVEEMKLQFINEKLCLCAFYKKSFFISMIGEGPSFIHYIDIMLEDSPSRYCFGESSMLYSIKNTIYSINYSQNGTSTNVYQTINKPIISYLPAIKLFMVTEGKRSHILGCENSTINQWIDWEETPYKLYDIGAYVCALQECTIEIRCVFDTRVIQKHELYSSSLLLSSKALDYQVGSKLSSYKTQNMVYLCEQAGNMISLVSSVQMSILNQARYFSRLKQFGVAINLCDMYSKIGIAILDDKAYTKLYIDRAYHEFFMNQNYEVSKTCLKSKCYNGKQLVNIFKPFIPECVVSSLKKAGLIIKVDVHYIERMNCMYKYGDYETAIPVFYPLILEYLSKFDDLTGIEQTSEKAIYFKMLVQILYVQFTLKLNKSIHLEICELVPESILIDILIEFSQLPKLCEYLVSRKNYLKLFTISEEYLKKERPTNLPPDKIYSLINTYLINAIKTMGVHSFISLSNPTNELKLKLLLDYSSNQYNDEVFSSLLSTNMPIADKYLKELYAQQKNTEMLNTNLCILLIKEIGQCYQIQSKSESELNDNITYLSLLNQLEGYLLEFTTLDSTKIAVPTYLSKQGLMISLFSCSPIEAINQLCKDLDYQRKCATICCNIYSNTKNKEIMQHLLSLITSNDGSIGLFKQILSKCILDFDLEEMLNLISNNFLFNDISDFILSKFEQIQCLDTKLKVEEGITDQCLFSIEEATSLTLQKCIVVDNSTLCRQCNAKIGLVSFIWKGSNIYHLGCYK